MYLLGELWSKLTGTTMVVMHQNGFFTCAIESLHTAAQRLSGILYSLLQRADGCACAEFRIA